MPKRSAAADLTHYKRENHHTAYREGERRGIEGGREKREGGWEERERKEGGEG